MQEDRNEQCVVAHLQFQSFILCYFVLREGTSSLLFLSIATQQPSYYTIYSVRAKSLHYVEIERAS